MEVEVEVEVECCGCDAILPSPSPPISPAPAPLADDVNDPERATKLELSASAEEKTRSMVEHTSRIFFFFFSTSCS